MSGNGSSTRLPAISRDPQVKGGLAVVRGTRFPIVQLLAEMANNENVVDGISEIADEFGYDAALLTSAFQEVRTPYEEECWRPPHPFQAKLVEHLQDARFASAKGYLGGQPDWLRDAVEALANLLGDSGWMSGNLGIIVATLTSSLIKHLQKETR